MSEQLGEGYEMEWRKQVAALTKERDELCAMLEKAEEALALLHKNIPSLRCDNFHHAKKDQHDTEETCPPLARHCYAEQCTVEALAAIKQWKEQA